MREPGTSWQEQSRLALRQGLERVRGKLAAYPGRPAAEGEAAVWPEESALGRLVRRFHLSGFETDLLLLAAGADLDAGLARLIAEAQGGRSAHPGFSLALSVLGEPHWTAMAPDSVLRQGRLIRLGEGSGLVDAPVAAAEAVLYYLQGLGGLDERLRPFCTALDHPAALAPSQEQAAARLVEAWCRRRDDGSRPKVHLVGTDAAAGCAIAAAACRALGFTAFALDVAGLPADRAQASELIDLWERDAVLHDLAAVLDLSEMASPDRTGVAAWLLDRLHGLVAVVGDRAPVGHRAAVARVQTPAATPSEDGALWRQALGPLAAPLNGCLGRLVEQFRLPAHAIIETAEELRLAGQSEAKDLTRQVWQVCRRRARGGLDDLAQRIDSRADWDHLVLPEPQMELLRSIAMQVRHRFEVYENWGFRARSSRGLGVSALFAGPSGAGKTLAAEVLAADLELDLYRIDLSAAVSKYIGETEKNLRRIFDAAEASGAILLFDEADALFGKRSEVKDSHDRYANLEISYLLQRVEAYRGLAILTTNLKSALDQAFLRRLRFLVQFPFPSAGERERIWQRVFPPETPLEAGLDWAKLARLAVTGGNIANIALDAAFRAAHEGSAVSMRHLLGAARAECAKIEKPLADNEIRGWV